MSLAESTTAEVDLETALPTALPAKVATDPLSDVCQRLVQQARFFGELLSVFEPGSAVTCWDLSFTLFLFEQGVRIMLFGPGAYRCDMFTHARHDEAKKGLHQWLPSDAVQVQKGT